MTTSTLSESPDAKISPMMQQWHSCKEIAGDALLFFRLGDFYEAFYEDAVHISRELDLTLTKRHDIPMAGVPFHASEGYIDKLVSRGYRVAVAEQTEDPKTTKGLVNREINRFITPGSIITSSLLSDRVNNYFCSITQVGSFFGFAIIDLTTAEFRVLECSNELELLNEIFRLSPSELLTTEKFKEKHASLFLELKQSTSCVVSLDHEWNFEHKSAYNFLVSHFKTQHLDGFGLKGMTPGINAAGALLHYLQNSLHLPIHHIESIKPYSIHQYMTIDRNTQLHLELTNSFHEGNKKFTLLKLLDKTHTPMGARLLNRWIKHPLLSTEEIHKRQEVIHSYLNDYKIMDDLSLFLSKVRDVERLMIRISSGYASPRDLVSLRFSFEPIQVIKSYLNALNPTPLLSEKLEKIHPLPQMVQLISLALVDEPPLRVTEGNLIRPGYSKELDEVREINSDHQAWLNSYQVHLREETGIKTLKVGFSRMTGYFIEVSKGQANNMPASFQRRQTLTNAERFISPELKEYETKVFKAEERVLALEIELFHAIKKEIVAFSTQVMETAQALAELECLRSLAEVARCYRYVCPIVDQSNLLHIKEGRHPIIEASLNNGPFIPNDLIMDDQNNRLLLITGPNMAGKSTYIRQVALIAIMAQMGSFVPASFAHVGILDKVFTRIGASDDLSRGQSTFMVEMSETANILNNATSKSLVILDEIGRGTSTYDGISIAWAVAEHLLTTDGKTAKTLFATHYWELTKLEGMIPGACNYHVAVSEQEDRIVFLRKIAKGGTDKSYGLHVGRLAGLPSTVIDRAHDILLHLEQNANRKGVFEPPKIKRQKKIAPSTSTIKGALQLNFF